VLRFFGRQVGEMPKLFVCFFYYHSVITKGIPENR
jgi:hypothetical protein